MTAEQNQTLEETPSEKLGSRTLYDADIENFRRALDEQGLEAGVGRFGFALFHSLEPEDRCLLAEEIGLQMQRPEDHYNLGVAHAMKGDLEKAAACWREALKADPQMSEAHFNLGLAMEQAGDKVEARDHYLEFLNLSENVEDKAAVQERIQTLG